MRVGWCVTQNLFLRPRRGLETFRSVVEGFDSGTYKSCFNDLSLSLSGSNFPHVKWTLELTAPPPLRLEKIFLLKKLYIFTICLHLYGLRPIKRAFLRGSWHFGWPSVLFFCYNISMSNLCWDIEHYFLYIISLQSFVLARIH